MGAVRVALLVGVRVMLAVIGHPADHRALDGHRAHDREEVFDGLGGLEGPVREHPVEADRDPEARDHVHHDEQREVVPADDLVPQQDDRGEESEKRHDDRTEVGDLRRPGHAMEAMHKSLPWFHPRAKCWGLKF